MSASCTAIVAGRIGIAVSESLIATSSWIAAGGEIRRQWLRRLRVGLWFRAPQVTLMSKPMLFLYHWDHRIHHVPLAGQLAA